MSESLGVIVVGCGNIADRYAADIARQTHVRLVGVTDLDAARATAFAAEQGTRAYRALEDGCCAGPGCPRSASTTCATPSPRSS